MNIKDRIEQFANQDEVLPLTTRVEYGFTYEDVKKIDQALRRANEKERFSLAVDLLRLWIEAGIRRKKELREEAESIFGQIFNDYSDRPLIYTHTATGRQLRVWYGRPACMEPEHVDSCGVNLLFGVYGDLHTTGHYLQAFCEIYKLDEILVPNGVRLYMGWRYSL